MPTLTLPCPAKLNLFLHILGKRTDGYHELQTVFQLLNVGDELQLTSLQQPDIELNNAIPGLAKRDNLVYKAAKLLQQTTQCRLGAKLQLRKVLPTGGGIGGGSSNAATTLVGLNHLWQTGVSIEELAQMARQLGADVPVFVHGKTAWAEGVGEKLQALELPVRWYVVLAPNCHVSTARIFSHQELTRDTLAIKVAAFLERGGKNDCQPLVERLFPQVRDAVEWLNQFGLAQLTGTGACVFAEFSNEREAKQVLARKPSQFRGFVARGENTSPLHQHLPS
ncbi:MAG: 4-(cytidine 5'-diphospho)-2-C-methyl-D-erythritol kinase [Cellvibrionaceae bacterium]|nr:4-(cytidine 5'-diphospho)-2-C-methyl-D-erythritol kinase [Cellvibrionaceae bacterium]